MCLSVKGDVEHHQVRNRLFKNYFNNTSHRLDRNKDDSDVIRKREKDGKKSTTRDLDRSRAKKFEERKKISPDKNNLSKPPHDKQTSERRPDSDRVRDSTRSDRGKERGSQQPPRDQGRQNSRDRGDTRRVRSRSPLQSERRR